MLKSLAVTVLEALFYACVEHLTNLLKKWSQLFMALIKMNNKLEENLDTGFKMFIEDRVAQNLAEATIKSYKCHWRQFCLWYDGTIPQINEKVILQYKQHLKSIGWKDISINSNIKHLKAIFSFWNNEGMMEKVKISFLKTQEEPKDTFTSDELKVLLKKPNVRRVSFSEYRTWAIINTLAGTGMRVGTLVNLKIEDLDFDSGLIGYRHTKNKKYQHVPMSPALIKVLKEYLRHRGGKNDEYVLPSENNTKLIPSSVTHRIKKYCKARGIDKGNSHLFRHTFAKHWILSGGEGLKLQKILGHSDMKMVQHYANLYGKDLSVGFDKHDLLSANTVEKIKI